MNENKIKEELRNLEHDFGKFDETAAAHLLGYMKGFTAREELEDKKSTKGGVNRS